MQVVSRVAHIFANSQRIGFIFIGSSAVTYVAAELVGDAAGLILGSFSMLVFVYLDRYRKISIVKGMSIAASLIWFSCFSVMAARTASDNASLVLGATVVLICSLLFAFYKIVTNPV